MDLKVAIEKGLNKKIMNFEKPTTHKNVLEKGLNKKQN